MWNLFFFLLLLLYSPYAFLKYLDLRLFFPLLPPPYGHSYSRSAHAFRLFTVILETPFFSSLFVRSACEPCNFSLPSPARASAYIDIAPSPFSTLAPSLSLFTFTRARQKYEANRVYIPVYQVVREGERGGGAREKEKCRRCGEHAARAAE